MKGEGNKPTKKPYQTPKLIVYGDIRKITETVGLKGNLDGGSFPKTRTHH